jgi:ribosomal protein S17
VALGKGKKNDDGSVTPFEVKVGDQVEIVECRPISRLKHWRLVAVLQAAKGAQKA